MSRTFLAESHNVIDKFISFQQAFRAFKKRAGLKNIDNVYEPVAGICDKLGRLVRHVKHNARDDPKDSFPEEAVESVMGIIAYLDLIIGNLDLDENELSTWMVSEMMKAVYQHGEE